MKLADVQILHQSDFFRVVDFKCNCTTCSISDPEYNNSFTISFIRKGFFEYRSFRRQHEIHAGRVLLSKPGYEHTTRHIDNQPDIVTIFDFKRSFYEETLMEDFGNRLPWILRNNDIHSVMLQAKPEIEYLHHQILKRIVTGDSIALEIDGLVFAVLERVMNLLGATTELVNIPDKFKQYHLNTIEAAQEYIFTHFKEDIPLLQLATHCLVSPFHFSRLFKQFTGSSPHQYLATVRLSHARMLVEETRLPVADIAYECGFSSPEHFVTAFRQYHKVNPSALRKLYVSK